MKFYLVMAMRRPSFDESVVAPHRAFLESLRADGRLHLAGGFSDGTGGAYLLANVSDIEEARAIVANDPLAIHASSELTIHEWNAH